ncbi:MAG: alpha/beta fold hydrolase [Candidatus Ancaeobacter aquaticus]|nr:alpha/beta fold hydrolase [Candidatus Ancaeobacter aquaticus]
MQYVLIYSLLSFIGLLFLLFVATMIWIVYTSVDGFLRLREPASTIKYVKPEGGESVQFYSADGVMLCGVFMPAKEKDNGTIIFCPEVDADSTSVTKYASFLCDKGYNILSVDFRGHGNSSNLDGYISRQWVSTYEVYDLLGAIEYIKSRSDIDTSRIGLFGVSRGGGAALCTAQECPEIKCVVTDSAFSTKKTLNSYMKKWTSLFLPVTQMPHFMYIILENVVIKVTEIKLGYKLPSVENAIKTRACPLLMIHGQRDTYIGVDQARMLYGYANDPKVLLEVPGARHNESIVINGELYKNRVTDFLHKNL